MSDGTRIVRLRPGIDREKLANDTTRVGGPVDVTALVLGDPERLFNVYQEEMHPIVAARGPGVAVFALSKRRGLEGRRRCLDGRRRPLAALLAADLRSYGRSLTGALLSFVPPGAQIGCVASFSQFLVLPLSKGPISLNTR